MESVANCTTGSPGQYCTGKKTRLIRANLATPQQNSVWQGHCLDLIIKGMALPRSGGVCIGFLLQYLPLQFHPIAFPDFPEYVPQPGNPRITARRLLIHRARRFELGYGFVLAFAQLRSQVPPDVIDAFAVRDPFRTYPIHAVLPVLVIGQSVLAHDRHAGSVGDSPL